MKTSLKTLSSFAFAALGLALVSNPALAESTYGYSSNGSGTVTATAKVNLSVAVPKLILLRVGSTNTTVDTLSWAVAPTIPGTPTTPTTTANNVSVDWTGAAPTFALASATATIVASAWTNATTGTINCSVGTWSATGGPTNANFTVSAGAGTLAHPGANLSACASTGFTSGSVQTSTWTYTLGGTPLSWAANTYTNTVTYTATGV